MKKYIMLLLLPAVMAAAVFPAAGNEAGMHEPWDALLQKYVKNGQVNYKGFAADVKQLDAYLAVLGKADLSAFSENEKLAFWINAYNAYTVKLILNHYPTRSIRKISRPWKRKEWNAAGEILSLDHMEHKILRKEFKEPRIHFAIVCASIGCPDLQAFAFTGEKVKNQLALTARQFFASRKHFYFNMVGTKAVIYISKIFSWFGEDFGDSKAEKAAFIRKYLAESKAQRLGKAESFKFKYLSYDWDLNEPRTARFY